MENSFTFSVLCVVFIILDSVYSFPIDISSVSEVANPIWFTNYFITVFGSLIIIFSFIIGCVCCRNGKGFKEFRNSSGNLAISQIEASTNPNSELTIFPPLGANANIDCRFEPLPEIKCQSQNLRPAAFSYTEQEISSQDWFFDPYSNFPRNQLKYVQEYGRGWFGRVVEGEAQNITPEEKVTKVMVKILHEDATPTDHMYFLHEVKFYRDLKHPNILRLLGRCLETEPFLIILECYPNGDLKTFLSQNLPSAQALVEQGVILRMCCNITSGLQYMHENKFIHTDLAARNCLVGPDLSVKIGDYGNSIEIFKSDYYCAGSVALPVRWCAPETLKCTDITIETREVTPSANIWSLGVVFWEICEFCKLPYAELSDDEVIVRVLGEKNYFLEKPNMICLYKDELYHLMKLCWKPPLQRPDSSQICVVLNNLISSSKTAQKEVLTDSKRVSQDFEQRWQNLKPNSIPKKDNAVNNRNTPVDCSIISSKLKNAKVADSFYIDSPLGIFMSNENDSQESHRIRLKFDKKGVPKPDIYPLKDGVKSGVENEGGNFSKDPAVKVEFDYKTGTKTSNPFHEVKKPETEMDSWLKGVEINNEEDESFVMKISEAIRDLDATLAMEKTSSSEENSGKSSHQNSPGKDVKEENEPVVDFKLGNDTSSFINFTQKSFDLASLQNTEQPQSLNFTDEYSDKKSEVSENYGLESLITPFVENHSGKIKCEALDESLKESDSLVCGQSRNSSDTDDEIWRRRIEKGEISEKVKEKSRSIANLMILTHIDSDDSDVDFDKPFDRGLIRNSFHRRSGSFAKSPLTSNNFGSENDLTFAVLEDDFKESLKKLSNDHKEHGHFDSLGVILSSSANRENVWENLFKPSKATTTSHETNSSEFNLNKTVKESEAENGKSSAEESEHNAGKRDNFLGNAASENFKNDALIDVENEKPLDKKLEKNSSEEEILLKEYLGRENKSSSGDSLKNSSHLGGFNAGSQNTSGDVPLENPLSGKKSVFMNDDELLNQKNNTEVEINGSCPPKELDFIGQKFQENIEKPDTESEVEKKKFQTVERVCESDCQPLRNLVKNDVCLPEITVSEVPSEALSDIEDEKFYLRKPVSRPIKFVFKDFEDEEMEESDVRSFFPVDNKFLIKNTGNSFDEFKPEENVTVIVGACEDFTMDYFRGLKTTFRALNEKIDDREQEFQSEEENLDVWDKHLEKAFIQQLNNSNFDDVNFKSFGTDCCDEQKMSLEEQCNFPTSVYPLCSIMDFIESEKLHTEKVEDPVHLTSLSVIGNEEEYEHFKLRTPDDERSSDSGFRDKGSLSESVEDAYEGKYNLEDIEAELEEAFVKGVFGNCEADKEKDHANDARNCGHFDFEESKFYEDVSKNEEDFSDIDGEIEFWHNKDESNYYPEISEFNPACSQGWYLHPPDETSLTFNRNVNEDVVNALRNELQESLPVQSRSFDEFNDFFDFQIENTNRDINIPFMSDLSLPLSPILEEQNPSNIVVQENFKNSLLDGGNPNKVKKSIAKLMESVKAVDTPTFMQYLDYMIENEGKFLDEIEETEEDVKENKNVTSPMLILEDSMSLKETSDSGSRENSESLESDDKVKTKDDVLVVNIHTNEATLVERSKPKLYFHDTQEVKNDFIKVLTDNAKNDSALNSEMSSPEREGSLSEMSRSSNESLLTGDALSEITLSSPDLVPDCFSNSAQEIMDNSFEPSGLPNEVNVEVKSKTDPCEQDLKTPDSFSSKNLPLSMEEALENHLNTEGVKSKLEKTTFDLENNSNSNDLYEMSTSFMRGDDEEDDTYLSSDEFEQKERHCNIKISKEDSANEDSVVAEWQSESSEDEVSSSSGEFIWKLFEKPQNVQTLPEVTENESALRKNNTEDEGNEDEDNESSTGSSASMTDFIPSAWNSQATPSRSALRSPDKKTDKQKKNVWFKNQKYHCIYEYPREPSDIEDADGPPNGLEKNSLETLNKHFHYGVDTVELPTKYFPYGISKVIDFSTCTDWDVVEGEDFDLSLTDTDSDNGSGKTELNTKKSDLNFYNLTPFDYDFNTSELHDGESEFFVSSSSRPFQGGSPNFFTPSKNQSILIDANHGDNKIIKSEIFNSKDFTTPDSGLEEDSTSVTPSESQDNVLEAVENVKHSKTDIINALDNLKNNIIPGNESEELVVDSSEEKTKSKNGFPENSMPNSGLGELRHTRGRLKLDLPRNLNSELGAIIHRNKH